MTTIVLSTEKTGQPIKPLHGVNGGPRTHNFFYNTSDSFREAGLPYARLHDVDYPMGLGEFVDIHCIFPDFEADASNPESYNFAHSDAYIKAIVETGCQVFYRLGESIDHGVVKKYIHPPKDSLQWARICEGIIRHYNEGWADGFAYGIDYWEIWNEPENPPMWTGSKEEYFELYRVAANYLKDKFPTLKIGGYASCGFYAITNPDLGEFHKSFITYFDDFLAYITAEETKAPLDFYSWHIYNTDPAEIVTHARYADEKLKAFGFTETENILNEWNYGGADKFKAMRRMDGACYVAGALCELQTSPVDLAMFYDAQPNQQYGGVFEMFSTIPSRSYYALKAFNMLYTLGWEATIGGDAIDSPNVHCLAATDGKRTSALLCNRSDQPIELRFTFASKGSAAEFEIFRLDETTNLTSISKQSGDHVDCVLEPKTVVLVECI